LAPGSVSSIRRPPSCTTSWPHSWILVSSGRAIAAKVGKIGARFPKRSVATIARPRERRSSDGQGVRLRAGGVVIRGEDDDELSDLGAGYPKIWLDLQALGWNRPEIRERVARVDAEGREVPTEAFVKAAAEYGLEPEAHPVDALVSLVMTFKQGIELEWLSGIIAGHDELLAWIDAWLRSREEGA
jgi:hypothetical protein